MTYTPAAAIKAAEGEIGYREHGENDTKYNHWLGRIGGYAEGGYGYPWCASFQSWVADQAGGDANQDYPKTAGCVAAVSWFKGMQRWARSPRVGDWVFYGPGGGTHVELVVGVSSSDITTIGGNTSGSLEGRYFNGDGVYRKTVARDSERIYGYGRPKYEEDDMPLTKSDAELLLSADIVPAPINPATGTTLNPENRFWTSKSYLKNIFEEVRHARVEVAATQAAVAELAKTVGQLAADRGQAVDADALIARIQQAIESVTVRLDVQPDAEDASKEE